MTRRAAILALSTAALAAAAAPGAQAGAAWTTGSYVGKAASDNAMPKDRGPVRFTITRTHARADRLTLVMRCSSGKTRRFTVRHAGRAALKPGPAGAGFMLRGERRLRGWDVEWDVAAGVHGSLLRLTVDASARDGEDDCLLFGWGSARPA